MWKNSQGVGWYVLRVRTKCEYSVARVLRERGYEEFSPAYRDEGASGAAPHPYFPGYVFCRFDPHNRLPILQIPKVLYIVGFGEGPAEVDQEEIGALKKLVDLNVEPEACPYIACGTRVRVIEGPLKGLEAIVLGDRRRARLVISVSLLMRSVSVEIDQRSVTVIRRPPGFESASVGGRKYVRAAG
jgi:transcription antitermination factor NusG